MITKQELRSALLQEMVDRGELFRVGGDYYEDMGGHVIHESQIDDYITEWMHRLDPKEREMIILRIGDHNG